MLRNILVYSMMILTAEVAIAAIAPLDLRGTIATRPTVADGIYQIDRSAHLKPLAYSTLGDDATNVADNNVDIPANLPFAVKVDGDTVSVTPMIAEEALGSTPDQFTFRRVDLEALAPKFLARGDTAVMYEQFSQDATTLVAAGRCKWYVERHLGFHVDGMCASSMSAGKLARVGFHPTSCSTAQLQVWGGGRRGCGHVAYRTHGGGWSSTDFIGDPGTGYYSKGCYSRR